MDLKTYKFVWLHNIAFILFFSIGCGIGYGYLHRIPIPDTTKPLKPPIVNPTTAGAGGFSDVRFIPVFDILENLEGFFS